MRRKIVVTGCGRIGTQWTSRVLRALGMSVGHEHVYTHAWTPHEAPPAEEHAGRWHGRDGDVSWLAAPFLAWLPEDAVVWHQLRDPRLVVRCWSAPRNPLALDDRAGNFAKAAAALEAGTPALAKAVQYARRWNRMVEDNAVWLSERYRIEDLRAGELRDMLARAGWEFGVDRVCTAMESVSPTEGTCRHTEPPPTWEQVEASCPDGPLLRTQAGRYGYVVD